MSAAHVPAREARERARRRNFSSLLILANLFRGISYLIVGLALVTTIAAGLAAMAEGMPDPLLRLTAGSAGFVLLGLGLFLGSELIRLLVGIGRDIARMSGRWDEPAFRPPEPGPGREVP